MSLLTLVVVMTFGILYFNIANNIEKENINAMKEIALTNMNTFDEFFKKEHKASAQTLILDLNTKTNTCYVNGLSDTEILTDEHVAYINGIIKVVNSSESSEGILKEQNFRFYKTPTPYGLRIVLLDKSAENAYLQKLLLSFTVFGILALLAFFCISVLIARIAVKPVERSMLQQRQLISDMSHELKTPLSTVTTNTDIVLSRPKSTVAEESKWLGYIKDETARMTDMVNMMLILAKNDEKSTKPCLTLIDFSSIILETALPFESLCFEKEKDFLEADEASIKQLAVILIDNAIKYSNPYGRIILSLRSQGEKAVLSVFNTGEPIPPEHLPRLFDRFYRVDNARSRESGGSGLGLSIAKQIIENNMGCISVSSSMENGTMFSCTFKKRKPKISN